MSQDELVPLLQKAFDMKRRYSAKVNDFGHDLEYKDALGRFDGRTWPEVKGRNIADNCPGFVLLPDDAFVFFFPSILNSLISSNSEDEVTVSLRFYYRRMQQIIKKASQEQNTSLLTDDQKKLRFEY